MQSRFYLLFMKIFFSDWPNTNNNTYSKANSNYVIAFKHNNEKNNNND